MELLPPAEQASEALVSELHQKLRAKDSCRNVVDYALKGLAKMVAAQNCALFLVDPDYPERMSLYASYNPKEATLRRVVKDVSASRGGGITSWCAEQPAPGMMDYEKLKNSPFHSRQKPDHLGGKDLFSLLWFPLRDGEKGLHGLLKCENKTDQKGEASMALEFAESDMAKVSQVAQVIHTAVEILHPVPASVREARKVIRRISIEQIQKRKPEVNVLQRILEDAVRILGADRGDFAWWKAEQRDLVYAATGPKHNTTNTEIVVGKKVHPDSFMRSVFSGEMDYDCDNNCNHREADGKPYVEAHPDVQSEIAVRIDLYDNPVGVLNLESFKTKFFDLDRDLATLRELAEASAVAVQQLLKNDLVTRALSEPENPAEMLQPILEAVLETFGYDAGILFRKNISRAEQRDPSLRVAASVANTRKGFEPAGFRHGLDKRSFARQVFYLGSETATDLGGAPPSALTCLRPIGDSEVDQQALEDWGIGDSPLFGFPIRHGTTTLGCFVLWTIEREFPRHQPREEVLEEFARLAAARLALWNATTELAEHRQFYKILAESSPLLVFTKCVETWEVSQLPEDFPEEFKKRQSIPKFEFEWGNAGFLAHVGKTAEELKGMTDWNLFPKHACEYYAGDVNILDGGDISGDVEPHVRPGGSELQVRVWKRLFDGGDGKKRIMVVFWDRTKEAQLEADNLLWSHDFIHRVSSCFRRAEEVISRRLEEPDPGKNKNIGRKIKASLRNMEKLVRLVYGRGRHDPLPANRFFSEVIAMVNEVYVQPQGSLVPAIHKNIAPLELSSTRTVFCARLLTELVANALSYAFVDRRPDAPAPVIECSLRECDGFIELKVSDNGVGISQDPKTLFENDTVGLGLVKRLVEQSLGGTLAGPKFEQTDGTSWLVKFPAVESRVARPVRDIEQPGPAVLLVEDDEEDREPYESALSNAGFTVLGPAQTSTEALEMFQKHRPPLVVVDIGLKGEPDGGVRVAQSLRKQARTFAETRILFLTDLRHGDPHFDAAYHFDGALTVLKESGTAQLVSMVRQSLRDIIVDGKIFICYPSEKAEICRDFVSQLKHHKDRSDIKIEAWSDSEIPVGKSWAEVIETQLKSAIAAVLLVDQAFMESAFIQHVELPALLQARRRGTMLFPVMVEATGTTLPNGLDLKELQFLGKTDQRSLIMDYESSKGKYRERVVKMVDEIYKALRWRSNHS